MMNATESLAKCLPSADAAFGPAVQGCRDNFDFTLAFEDYFFSIAPSALLLLLTPLRLRHLFPKRRRVSGNEFKYVKLAILVVFAVIQLTITILWATQPHPRAQGPSTAAAALSFTASLALCFLSPLEHAKSLRPSLLINVYLLISLLFDIVILRTMWLTSSFDLAIRNVFTASFALKTVVLLQEAFEKRRFLQAADQGYGPESTSGIYSQGLFWWLNGIIRKGFRQILLPGDLYPIDQALESEAIDAKFWQTWNESTYKGKHKLVVVIFKTLKWPLLIPIPLRFVLMAFTYCQPLLVTRFLDFLQNDENANIGHGLIGAYAIVYVGIAISNGFYEYRLFRSLTMIRGLLVAAIFKKTTEISITAIDNKASLTLMSTDVERVIRGLRGVHDLWASVFEIILATYLLERQLGAACAAPFIVVAVAVGITMRASGYAKTYQSKWMKKIQKRIGITSSMLGAMKGVKMSGLTDVLTKMIQSLRVEEVQSARSFRLLGALTSSIASVPLLLAPVVTFAVFAIIAAEDHKALDATRLFTSLSLLLLVTQPMFYSFQSIVDFVATLGCVERIEKFLLADSRLDHRLMRPSAQLTRPSQGDLTPPARGSSLEIQLVELPLDSTSKSGEQQASDADSITVRDGTFGWKVDSAPVLKDINLCIKKSRMTMIIGPVGSGKTTLCKSLLGEVPSSKGLVYISLRDVSFCDQTPWLINASVQKNITAYSHLDQERYDLVIYACDLESDIRILPDGHDTLIGSKGIALSGGQKQRVALARSLYAMKEVAIFDDIFSGLDKNTSKNIFNRVFGRHGFLRTWGTTVILATHSVNLLPAADHIIALNADGKIAEQGSFQTLNASDGYVHNFFLEHIHDQEKKEEVSDETLVKEKMVKTPKVPAASSSDKKRQTGDISTYTYYFKSIGLSQTVIWLFLEAAWAFFYTFPTIWLKWWTDANSSSGDHQTGLYLGVYTVFQVLALAFSCSAVYFSLNVIAAKAGIRLHEITLDAVMSAPLAFFTKTDTGSLTNRFSQDMGLLDHQLPLSLMVVVNTLFLCIAQAFLIATASVYIAIAFPGLIGVYFVIQRYYLRTSRQLRLLDIEQKAPVYTQFLECLSGLATIRAFAWQDKSISQNHELLDDSQRPFYLLFMVQRWLTLVLDLINTVLAVIVVTVASQLRGQVSVGFTGVSLVQVISFTASMKLVIMFWTQLENSLGAVARIKEFKASTQNENLANENATAPEDWPHAGAVEISGLSATYDPTSPTKTLDNISLSIKPGQHIGICGRTGSGKSSLILTLLRLLDPTSGTLLIDSHDLTTLPRQLIRSRINVISQDPFFLHGSIRMNLDPYMNHLDDGDKELERVMRDVGLWEIVERKEGGLDAEFSEDMFSHGQRQLFCLARAMLRRRTGKLLILDEATASLDKRTDSLIQRLIRTQFPTHTIIAIAHRLETIMDFDQVVVLDEGKVVEVGTPAELLEKDVHREEGGMKGWFREMWEADRGYGGSRVGDEG